MAIPQDERLTFRKEGGFNIEALDGNGNALARDGFAFTADPVCTPEEIAAAGTGPGAADSVIGRVWLVTLLGLGVAGIAGGAMMRRIAS